MNFDPQVLFAELTEKERVYGHHSAEGRAIRTLSRALQGWGSGSLGGLDVVTMCDQAIEVWLKARLEVSAWSATGLRHLLAAAEAKNLLTPTEASRLQTVRDLRADSTADGIAAAEVEAALADCLQIVEKHWS